DLIGVQTAADARRLRLLLPADVAVRVHAFPVSIDPEEIRALVADTPAATDDLDGSPLFFGVDRLDYTKGIPQRLEGYRRAIEQHSDLRRAKFVQWAAPSRTEIPDYQAERLAVEDAAAGVEALAPGVLNMSYEAHE